MSVRVPRSLWNNKGIRRKRGHYDGPQLDYGSDVLESLGLGEMITVTTALPILTFHHNQAIQARNMSDNPPRFADFGRSIKGILILAFQRKLIVQTFCSPLLPASAWIMQLSLRARRARRRILYAQKPWACLIITEIQCRVDTSPWPDCGRKTYCRVGA